LRPSVLKASHNLGLIVALGIVIAVGAVSYLDDQAYKSNAAAARQSRSIVDQTEELLSHIKDAETGQRGFLLTGDPSYLEPYASALPQIRRLLSELSRPGLEFVDPVDNASLAPLTAEKLGELARTIEMRRRGRGEEAIAMLQTNHGKRTMDRLRAAAARVIEAEAGHYATRAAAAGNHANRTRVIILLGTIVLALLLLASTAHVNGLIGTRDRLIVDLGLAHEQEARAKATFETTLRSIGDAVIATDTAGKIQFMNAAAEALTGWTSAACTGHPLPEVFRIINESTRGPVENPADKVLRDGVVVGLANHTILVAKDGSEIPIDDSGAPIHGAAPGAAPGVMTGVVLVFRDVTQRRQTQRELEESESRYRLLFDSNPEAMWVYDAETLAFLMVNDAAIERYGYSREEYLGMTIRDIRPPEDVAALEANLLKPRESHTDGPWRHRKKDGTLIYVEITAHPIKLGAARGCLIMAKDVTDRRHLEEQLRQSQKLEAVGHLAGGIAHDFNNLLTVIEGYAEMIHADQAEDDPNRASTQEILIASQRAASLTQQLLAFSRRQILQPRRINLNTGISHTHKMLIRLLGEDIQIVTILAPDLNDVSADPGQIDQIILNLSVNARDAMELGGTLTIETANVDITGEDSTRHIGIAAGRYVRLCITDTGHGMDEQTRLHIFEPFFTTKELGRGTGLGLSTVYGIVKQSGGSISAYSEPGKGTTFTIYLPSASGQQLAIPETIGLRPARQATETVLVVEDDDTVRKLVTAMLSNAGYTVLCPETPDEALGICADREVRIDLLLTDMVLPHTDGTAVAHEASLQRPDLKVLFMSGYTEHAVLRRQAFDRTTPFLQKPFTQSMLANKVREVLEPENRPQAGLAGHET
jgi:two-component system, cell cycle sensor histidine kinase and response regulator CckA